MTASAFRTGNKARIYVRKVDFETLEGRRLLSASSVTQAALSATPSVVTLASASQPSVATVTPAAGATAVALNQPITCTLNLPNGRLDANTVINANVTLYPTGNSNNNAFVPGVVNTSGGGDDIVFTPSINLQVSTKYTFTVTAAVKDVTGVAMVPFSSTFTTGTVVPAVNPTIAFSKTALSTTQGTAFTCMQIGPDGRLYASTEDGRIFRYIINADGTLGVPQIITSLQTYEGGNRLISGFAFDPASTASNPIIWVSNTFYALSAATNGVNFTGKLTVMSGPDLTTVEDAIINLPRSISDHVNDQPVFQPGTDNLFFCQAGQNAYGAPDTTWGNRPETMLSSAILEVNTTALNLSTPLNVLTPDASVNGVAGTYNPFAAGAPLTIYADGIRNAFTLFFDSTGQLWAPANGSSSGGNTPGYTAGASGQVNGTRIDTGQPYAGVNVPALNAVAQTEEDVLFKVQQGKYYGHPNPSRGEYVLDDGNPTTGAIPGLAFSAYPSGTNPDPNYQPPNYIFGVHNSPDGMIQYTGSAFGGALNGKFLVTEYSAGDDIVVLSTDANDNIIGGLNSTASGAGPDRTVSGFSGFNLPVTLLENPATGYIYVSELGTNQLTLLKPESVAPQISSSTTAVAFNSSTPGSAGAGPSHVETVTITNTGATALVLGSSALSIVNDPNAAAPNAANYTIVNSASVPASLAGGQSFAIQLSYTASAVNLQPAILQITSNDPVTPTLNVELNGIGTAGQFGYNEPSLVQVLRANNIPTIVGAGPNDVNINVPTYPITPDPSSTEVPMQRLQVAGTGPVTITPLASFNSTATPVLTFGYYTPGESAATTSLFTFASTDSQTVDPTPLGITSFNPGSRPFGLYATFTLTSSGIAGVPDTHYSEDALNTRLESAHPRKFRFFPLENPDGSVVANAYIVAAEDYNGTTYNSFVNFVGIIRNVMPATDATSAPVVGISYPANVVLPGSNQLPFTRIQIPNTTVPDIEHNTNTITITNSGDQSLSINSLTLSDTTNWTLVNPPAAGTLIAPGGSQTVTIQFIATTVPPHTTSEINDTAPVNDAGMAPVTALTAGGVWDGTLTVSTNDPVTPNSTVNLAGYWQHQTEHENEPGLQTLVNLIFGSGTVISTTPKVLFPNNGRTPVYYGQEVLSGLWSVADPSQPISLVQLASYHNEYDATQTPPAVTTAAVGYYLQNSSTTTFLFKQAPNAGQTILPPIIGIGSKAPVTSFTPSGVFGWNLDGEKSQDILNPNDLSTSFSPLRAGHGVRFFPVRDASGNIVPNTWIMGMDYQAGTFANADFQDNLYLVRNMTPAATPAQAANTMTGFVARAATPAVAPTPAGVQASISAGGILIQWLPSNGATSYNLYRNGSTTKLNAAAITGTSYLDTTAPAGTSVTYEVRSVLNNVESKGLTTTLSLIGAENGAVVPAPPASLTADGSSGTVVLGWAASPTATSYAIEREDPGTSTFVQIAANVTATSYTDMTVTQGQTYEYRLRALNSEGYSDYSATIFATVAVILTPPAAPASLTGDGSSGTQVVLNWTASPTAASYFVEREDPGSSTFVQIAASLTATTYTDTAVTQGQTYIYRVRAMNSAGYSVYSGTASVTVAVPLTAPLAPTQLTVDDSSGTVVVLNWIGSAGATDYRVERMGPDSSTFTEVASDISATTYTDSNVVLGDTYVYQVRAENAAGLSAYSNQASATLPPPLATLDVTVGKGANKTVRFVDGDGTVTTVSIAGRGLATIHFSSAEMMSQTVTKGNDVVTGTNVSIASISTTNTVGGSSLHITTKGGNGTVTIGAISTDAPIGAIIARTATLIGSLSVTGSIGTIAFGTGNGGSIQVSGALHALQVNAATGLGVTVGGRLGTITANSWNSTAMISAPIINAIQIKADATLMIDAGVVRSLKVRGTLANSTLTLTNAGVVDLGALAAGSINHSQINTVGGMGRISANTLINSQIFAGIAALPVGQALPAAPSDFVATANIASITLKRIKGGNSDVNSSIAAAVIAQLSLANIQTGNNAIAFGVAATLVRSFSAINPANAKPFTFKRLTSAAIVASDLAAKKISLQDFVLTIL